MIYQNSKLLKIVFNRYNLRIGSKINYKVLNEISEYEKIEIKDLLCLLQINYNTYYKLRKNSKAYTRIKLNKYEYSIDDKLEKKGEITKYEFYRIQDDWQIKRDTLIRILGASKYQYNKMNKDDTYKMRIINIKIKHIVDLIKLDLKYLDKRNEKYYTKVEINYYCKQRGISLEMFLKYYSINLRHYKFNKLAIEKSDKGLWMNDVEMFLPQEFAEVNYLNLNRKCEKLAKIKAKEWNCEHLVEDFFRVGSDKIIMGGLIVKKFYFDLQIVYNILMVKAKYAMLNYYKKHQNKYIYFDKYEKKYSDHLNILRDEKNDPQIKYV